MQSLVWAFLSTRVREKRVLEKQAIQWTLLKEQIRTWELN